MGWRIIDIVKRDMMIDKLEDSISGLLRALAIFDFYSPIYETAKDIDYLIRTDRDTYTLFVNDYDEREATEIIESVYRIVSKTRTSTDMSVGITVPKFGGTDSWGSVRQIIEELQGAGIEVSI